MKKIISVFMVAVCLMMAAPAQAQLHFGVKGGLNLSKVSFSKSDLKGDNKTGWFIGPMAEFTLPLLGLVRMLRLCIHRQNWLQRDIPPMQN